ncbi:hypothetical protein KR054_002788 [Drosophila jambulina]|nr:hypothetical protein KR054_002788 [Drosophila jambulina]
MSLNGARLRYVDENGEVVLVAAKGRTFQIGSYFSCDVILEPQAERLICEITCDAFGRVSIRNVWEVENQPPEMVAFRILQVTLLNQSNKDTAIHLNDKIIHGQRSHPLLHGNRITILDRVYTWESHKMPGSEDGASTPERQPPVEQAPNSCPSLKVSGDTISASKYSFMRPIRPLPYLCLPLQSHRPQIDKRLTVHNFHYSINSDDEGNTSIESRDQNESRLDEQESLNVSTPPSTEMPLCETPKVDLVEATQNKENTATPTTSHRQLLQLCALSDVVITSFSPRETGVKVEKSFTCVRKPTKMGKQAPAASVTMSTPKSVYSTPKGGVLSELNDDSCSRDLMDFCTPSTSKKTKRQSSMYLIDLTTPSKLRPSLKPTPISVDSTDESSDGSPIVIDITKSPTPPTAGRSHLAKTPRRLADAAAAAATPTRTPQSLMKRALLTSTKKKQIAANQMDRTPVATPNKPSPRRLCRTAPRMPFVTLATPEQKEARRAVFEKSQTPKSIPHKRQSLHLGTPRDNKLSQIRKSLAAAKRSPIVDFSIRLTAKARRTLNSPKSSSLKSGSSKPSSPTVRQTINISQPKCFTPEKLDDSTKDELSRTFTIINDSGDPAEEGSILGNTSALITEEMENSVSTKVLETTHLTTETKEDLYVEDQLSENRETELKPAVATVKSPNENDSKLCENGTQSFVESSQETDHLFDMESTKNCSIQANGKVEIIEDSICEEVHANIPKQLDDDETPMIRRSLRRLSVDQKAGVATTPRRGSITRRDSVGAINSQAETKTDGIKRATRRASCSALVDTQEVSGTPRRKRRLSEQMCTPTRQSKRLMMNTPKTTVQVDDSIGDMGVIVEENDDEKSSVVEDENYGKELPCDEPDNVDYHGLRDLLKTPKNCSTPRFKGLREMMRTPKVPASPIFGNIEELLDNSNIGSTPHHNKTSRSITVARVAAENRKALEGVLKTPSARNIMVPNEPASAILKSRGDSLAATTEYDLEMTNTTLHLDQIFDDVPSTSVANMEDTEAEINVTALSTASGLDPLRESVSSEAPISVSKLEAAGVASRQNDPLTSTTYKTAMQADLELSTLTEEGEATSRPSSLGSNEMSGMQLLDQTSDSIFSEPLIVSGVESCNVTVDETRALGQTTYQPLEINDIDTDSNVGLTEPLVVSDDDDDEAEVLEDSRVTSKKTAAPEEVSIAYKFEESIASKDITLNQSKGKQSVNETPVVGEPINRENESLIDEVSLIEVNESLAGDSISTTKDGKSLVIELDSSSDTDAEPTRENDASAAVELTIVESETFPLDSTQEDEVSASADQNAVESGSEEAELLTKDPSHPSVPQIETFLPSEEVLEKSRTADVVRTDTEKESDVSVAPETIPLDARANNSIILDEELSTIGDHNPIDSESTNGKTVDQSEKAIGEDVSMPTDSETLPLDSITDSLKEEISTGKTAEEDQSVNNALPCKELAEDKITGDDEKENDVSAVVGSEILSFDLTADSSVLVEEEQKQIDSELSFTTNELSGNLPVIDALPSEEQAGTKETVMDPEISPLDSTADSFSIHVNPQADLLTNDDQKQSDSEPSITKEDSKYLEDPSVIDTLLSEETDTDKLPVDEKLSDAMTENMVVQSLGEDAEPNKIGEVSDSKEPKPGAKTSDAEKTKAEPEQTALEVPRVDDIEIQKGDAEELPTCASPSQDEAVFETPTPSIQDVEVVPPTEESAVEALASPSSSPASIDVDETSAKQDTNPIDTAQEVREEPSIVINQENIKEDAAEPEIEEDVNPCGDQKTKADESKILATEEENEADKTQVKSLCEAGSDQEKPTISQLSTSESASGATAEKSPSQEVDPSEESNAADITAGDQKERDLPSIDDLAVTKISEDEVKVSKTDVMDDSTSLETTQSCSQEPVSPKVVPPADNIADTENSLNASSLIMESFTEQPKPASTEGNLICPSENPPIQGESEDEVNRLDQSNKAEDVSEDSVVIETPKAKSIVTDPEVVATSKELSAQQEELKPIEESSDRLKMSNEVEETSIDTAAKESLKDHPSQKIPSTTAEVSLTHDSEPVKDDSFTGQPGEKCQDEAIAEIMESSAPFEALASSAVAESLEISSTEAPNASIAVDGTQEASTTANPSVVTSSNQDNAACDRESESAKDKPQADDANSEGKSVECEMHQTDEAVQEISLAEVVVLDDSVSATDNGVKSLSESEEKAKEVVKNPSVTDDEVMTEELAEGTSAHISEGEQPQADHHHVNDNSPNQRTIQSAAIKEGSDVIDLSYDSSSESPPVEEDGKPAPVPTSEAKSQNLKKTLPTVKSEEAKVEDIPGEGTTIAEDRNTVKEVADTIDISDDSDSQEDHNPSSVTACETEASVPIKETLPTENSKETKVEDVPEEGTPIAEDRNTDISDIIDLRDDSSSESAPIQDHNIGPAPASEGDAPVPIEEALPTVDSKNTKVKEGTVIAKDRKTTIERESEANTSVSVIEMIATQDPNDAKIEDVSDELQKDAPAAPATNQEEQAEQPQVSEDLEKVQVEAAETTSITESIANVKEDEKSKIEDFASSSAISTEKVQSSEEVSSSVELHSEEVKDVETSIKEATNSENIQNDKPATPLSSRLEPEKSKEIMEPSSEPAVSQKHSTMKASHTEPSNKDEIKPEKRATRKASASMETNADDAMGRSTRRARKPSAEAAEVNSNDIHEKPKRRVLRKASAEAPEPMTEIQDQKEDNKKEEVLEVIPEEAHPAVSEEVQKEDALEKPKRRARKPSEEVKSAEILEKPKRRARKASADVPEPMVHIEKKKKEPKEEEQAHSSKTNEHHEPGKGADSSQQPEVDRNEEPVQNKMETPEEPDDQSELPKEEGEELKKPKDTKKVEIVKPRTERPKRRGRKASAEETETTSGKKPKIDDQLEVIEEKDTPTSAQIEQEEETHKTERPKRRGRKASAEEDSNNVPAFEKPLANASEDQPSNITEPNGPQKRTRKSSEFVPAEVQGSARDADHTERPKRRGRKPSVDIEHVVQDVPDKPRRRGRTPADPEKPSSDEAKDDEPDKKSRRTARKPSAETVDAVAHNIEVEQLKDIEEVAEPEPEPEVTTEITTPHPEEEETEPKTRRRGRKLPSKNTAEVGHSRLRGRKATEDETPKSEDPVEEETNVEEEHHNIVPADSNKVQELPADVVEAEVPAAETKAKRRVRKASANVDEGTAVAKKTATRRGRKEDIQNDDNGQEKIDLQQVPTESEPAVVVMSGRISEGAVGSGDEVTPRRREGRNMPRKNYDETSDEDKQRSARRPRKPASSKLLAFKDDSTPLSKSQPVEDVETPTNTVSIAEPTSTQRREGRNVPRKNYTEAPDDDKPATSRNRRIRNLSAKALELIVDTPPRPITPRKRKVKAAAKDETPAKRASLEAAPPAQPASKTARGKGRKAKVESDLEEDVPTKKARGGTRAKTPVKPPEDKSTTEPEEHSPPTKKGRGGARAKTPVAVIPEDAATKPEDEPVKKPPARSRARGGAKAVAVPELEQPAQESDVEPVLTATTTSRGGRAKKVHFEATEPTTAAAAASAEDAPKRATRSRRK